jgi:hypothetical protein
VRVVAYVVLAGGGIALSTWQSQLNRDAAAAHWIVALIAATAVAAAVILGRGRQRRSARAWAASSGRAIRTWRSQPGSAVVSVVTWTVLIAGVIGWDLASFIVQSHRLPTLSDLIGHITRYPAGRGLLFAVWLVIGAYLVSAWRTEAPQ